MSNAAVATNGPEHTVTFVDLAGFSALTEAHGDDEASALIARFCAVVRDALGPQDRLVKSIGDAVMLVSDTPDNALDVVRRVLESLAREPNFPVARSGMHHGPVVERDGDVFGTTVNLAARVAARAFGGQVLGTAPVADAARRAGRTVVDLGSFTLRNMRNETELFEIHIGPPAPGGAVDPVCRMRVERDAAAGRLRFQDTDHWFCSLACAAAFAADPAAYATRVEDARP